MRRTFLLDGTALAYRAHFAFTGRSGGLTTSTGHPTSATYGFLLTLRALLQSEEPDRIAVAFDGPRENLHRVAIYPEYKATREKAPDELVVQFDDLRELVEAYGIPILELPGQEADDVIGTLAVQCKDEGDEVYIVTADKDFMQLVEGERLRLYDIRAKRGGAETQVQGPEQVVEKFGVPPEQIIDLLALMGDSSDNVPGVPGIGPKKAAQLLTEYGSLDKILASTGEMKKSKQRENLETYKDQALLSRDLVTIVTDLEMDVKPESLGQPAPDREKLLELFQRWEFKNFVTELIAQAQDEGNQARVGAQDYRIVESLGECKALARRLRAAGSFAFDTETTSIDVGAAELVGMSFAAKLGQAFYVPLLGPDLPEGHDRDAWLEPFKELLEDASIKKCGQNAKYDIEVMRRADVRVEGFDFDTMLASYLANPARRHNLDDLSREFFGYNKIATSEIIGKGAKAVTMADVEHGKVGHYACEDADFTLRLREPLETELEENDVRELFDEIELPLMPVLVEMEERGIKLDVAYLEELSGEFEGRLAELTDAIYQEAGEEFNIGSPKQIGEVLFEKVKIHSALGKRPPKKTRTGQWATDAKVLESFGEHPLIAKLLNHRQLTKLKGTYVDALPKLVRESTGRVHTSFNQAVAATGRLSSDNPNLQNIPIRTEEGRRIRKAFVPGKRGWRLISADYSQVELRILAHLSGDENLIEGFRGDEDVHTRTAALVFGVMPETVGPELRSHAKAINYGLIYGMGPQRLAGETGMKVGEAKKFIEAYFAADAPGQGMDRQEPGGCADRGGDAHPLGSTPPDPRDQRRRAEIAGQRGEHRAE
jgi:DNA polymerase-1